MIGDEDDDGFVGKVNESSLSLLLDIISKAQRERKSEAKEGVLGEGKSKDFFGRDNYVTGGSRGKFF